MCGRDCGAVCRMEHARRMQVPISGMGAGGDLGAGEIHTSFRYTHR
jgi:hypothetical protein